MILTTVGNVVEMLLRRQESVTSDDIKSVLARAGVQISDSELAKALMEFLRQVLERGLVVRRVNIRQVLVFPTSRLWPMLYIRTPVFVDYVALLYAPQYAVWYRTSGSNVGRYPWYAVEGVSVIG